MARISRKDLDYHQGTVKDDKFKHHRDMMNVNMPQKVLASYEGFIGLQYDNMNVDSQDSELVGHGHATVDHPGVKDAGKIWENYLAISVNRITPSLYYQVPMPNITSKPTGSPYSAEVLNGLTRQFFDNKAKVENQKCILDAFLPYGYGVMKIGYNSRVGVLDNQRASIFTGKTAKVKGQNIDMETSAEYVKYERPFYERQSPAKTFLDCTKGFNLGQRITFKYDRTLQELKDSNLYSLDSNFLQFFGSKTNDDRSIMINLTEHWFMQDGAAWKIVWVEEWPEAIYYDKTPYPWLPVSLLRFNNTPDRLYTRSQGSQGADAQEELQYLNELWKNHIDKHKKMNFVNTSGLTENGRKTFLKGEIEALVECSQNPASLIAQFTSQPMSSDVYNNISNVRSYLTQLLSVGGAVSGDVSAEKATQERAIQFGNYLSTSGMTDSIRDFNNDQLKKSMTTLIKWGEPSVTVSITKQDIIDPFTGMMVTGQDLAIGGNEGVPLKEQIIGDVDRDYNYDIDMASSARPDYAVVRKQLMEYGEFLKGLLQGLVAEGKKVNWGSLAKKVGKTFTEIPNAGEIVQDMTEEEQAQNEQAQQEEKQQDFLQAASEPTEEAIVRGANGVGASQQDGGF